MKKMFFPIVLIVTILTLIASTAVPRVTVWLIGDSTMAAKPATLAPESGWGEGLRALLKPNVVLKNRAVSGASTLSYLNEGRWKSVLDSIKPGDHVVIQFGHNDSNPDPKLHTDPFGSYQANIRRMIESARKKGANIVVCTPIVRRHFDGKGKLLDTHGDYVKGAWEVALATYTPCIDMEALTRELVTKLGPEGSKKLFAFNDMMQDSTHVSQYGANEFARMFKEDVERWIVPMKVFK
jgi:lysophospholipase L1-like esterase